MRTGSPLEIGTDGAARPVAGEDGRDGGNSAPGGVSGPNGTVTRWHYSRSFRRVGSRREQLLDAAISLLGEDGARALTHRAVDAGAGLPTGSTSNYFRTRDALVDGIVERFAARERANWEDLAARTSPTTPQELAQALAVLAQDATGRHRTLTLARYAILLEAARRPSLRSQLGATGSGVSASFATLLASVGSADPDRDTHLVLNYWTGLVLHQLSLPDPAFDPCARLTALLGGLLPRQPASAGSLPD
jgi:DNA-binding transcriptional regulator YbjK